MQLRLGQAYQVIERKKQKDIFVIVEIPVMHDNTVSIKTYSKCSGEKLFDVREFIQKIESNIFARRPLFDKPGQLDFWYPDNLNVEATHE